MLLRLTGNERGELLGRTPAVLFPAEDVSYLMQQYAIVQRNRPAILDGVAEWRHGPLTDDMSLVLVELR